MDAPNNVQTSIAEIASDTVLLDPSDLNEVASLMGRIQAICPQLSEDSAKLANTAITYLEEYIFSGMDHKTRMNPDTLVETISQLISEIQIKAFSNASNANVGTEISTDAPVAPAVKQATTTNQTPPTSAPEVVTTSAATNQKTPSNEVKTIPESEDLSIFQDFVVEAMEHLTGAEAHLLVLEREPNNDDSINTIFRAFHTIKGIAGLLQLDELQLLAHESENLLDRVRKHSLKVNADILDCSLKALDLHKKYINQLSEGLSRRKIPAHDPQHDELIAELHAMLDGKTQANPPAPIAAVVEAPAPTLVEAASAAIAEQQQQMSTTAAPQGESAKPEGIREPIKVDAERLDLLIEMIGEIVIAESMVQQDISHVTDTDKRLSRDASHLHKITRELQGLSLSLRMLPVRPVFQKMARLVRDVARKADKKVILTTEGEETELDKSVVDKLGDPLVHMIRNSVDHGIETTAERIKAGKSEAGNLTLRAYHRGGSIYIELSDDGKGLDRVAILAKARERGLVGPETVPTDREIDQMIFLPGFSTAKQITGISGRGVGMDVVLRNIQAMRGAVDVKSEQGVGTTITLRLPLTLAIIDGMLMQVGSERYIIPTLSMVEALSLTNEHITTVTGKGELIRFRGGMLPLFRLSSVFEVSDAELDLTKGTAIVLEDGTQRIALFADKLLGQQQVVIKSLGETLRGIPGIAGGAILSDGRIGLIIDISGFIAMARSTDTI